MNITYKSNDHVFRAIEEKAKELVDDFALVEELDASPKVSDRYQRCRDELSGQFATTLNFLNEYDDFFSMNENSQVLNVSAGISASSLALALTGASVTSLEFALSYGKVARVLTEFGRAHLKQKGIFVGNISFTDSVFTTKIPYPEQSFDLVFCSNVLEKVKKPSEFIQELSRITKPGGAIIVRQRFSLAPNILRRDPHYGLPLVAVLPKSLRKIIGTKLREENWPMTHAHLRNWISKAPDLQIEKWSAANYGRWPVWKSYTAASVISLKKTSR